MSRKSSNNIPLPQQQVPSGYTPNFYRASDATEGRVNENLSPPAYHLCINLGRN
ncbi:MAG: hypothetical protein RLY40_327 [Pseudomonadota bacterium]|jgi:hypothetical protein